MKVFRGCLLCHALLPLGAHSTPTAVSAVQSLFARMSPLIANFPMVMREVAPRGPKSVTKLQDQKVAELFLNIILSKMGQHSVFGVI